MWLARISPSSPNSTARSRLPGCDKDGPSPAKTKKELLIYLRDSFAAVRKSLSAMDSKNMFDPIEGPHAGPNTRLGMATVIVWHNADHYGQMLLTYARTASSRPPAAPIRRK